jgi:hypothetical protein
VKSWQAEFDEGVAAFKTDPGQSIRGKNDVFRQGFYSCSSAVMLKGYTHVFNYEVYLKSADKWVPATFRTTADAVRRHRCRLAKNGARNITARKIATKGK